MAEVKLEPGRKGEERRVAVRLSAIERRVLAALPARLRELLLDPATSPRVVDRLFPPAHRDDPAEEAAHRRLIGTSLFEERRQALEEFEKTLTRREGSPIRPAVRLSAAEHRLWLHVINDFRLLLATELDIQDNEWSRRGPKSAEDAGSFQLLLFLSALQEMLLDARPA